MSQLGNPKQLGQIGHTNTFGRPDGAGARNQNEHICCIVNPRAGSGAAGKNIEQLKRAIDHAFVHWEIRQTEGPGHASALAQAASSEDFHLIAAVGGDGTCHEVINGMMQDDHPRNRRQAFTVIPFGTGSDLIKSVSIPRKLSEALWIAATGVSLPTDVGKASLLNHDGTPTTRYFINVAGFGANGEVVRQVNSGGRKRMGGRLAFLEATVKAALRYRPAEVQVRWEEASGSAQSWQGSLLAAFLANGAYCGGGMWVGRGGSMQDGLLDFTRISPIAPLPLAFAIRRLYDGHIERAPQTQRMAVRKLEVRAQAEQEVLVDLDGESGGTLPAHFEVLPRVLHVRGGWMAGPLTG